MQPGRLPSARRATLGLRTPAAWWIVAAVLVAGCAGPAGPTPSPTEAAPGPPLTSEQVAEIAAQLSAPRFPPTPLAEEHWIESFDGTDLRIRIYRPDAGGEWRAPILLHMSPYFGPEDVATDGLDAWLIEYFVPRGYAVALSDVRGTGQSGGCLEHTGRNEARDGHEVVEHLAEQPWTNGRVGMIGISYDGETQQATLTTNPPHLATIVPLASIAGLYDHVYFDAVPYTSVGLAGAVSYAAQGMVPPRPDPTNPLVLAGIAERPACHAQNIRERGDPRGDFNPYWEDRELRRWLPQIRGTSVFYVHGLEDWNVKPIHIAGWYNELDVPKHAWIGQWQHDFPDENSFRGDWSRSDWRFAVHRWFDHWLLGIDTGIMQEPAVQVQDSAGRWRWEDAWPPASTTPRDWFPDSDGTLAGEPALSSAWISYADNSLSMESDRGGSVSWASEPLAWDLHYAGIPRLEFSAILSSAGTVGPAPPGTHFAAHLVDVAPDGSERIVNRGYRDAQHRNGLNQSEPVPEGQSVRYALRFYPQDDVVRAGHRLVLRLGAVDDWTQPDGTNANVAILLGGDEGARLALPLADDASARFFTPPRLGVPTV